MSIGINMIKARRKDKQRVVEILSAAFDTNQSVNYLVKQDEKRRLRIRRLMAYAFEVCLDFGKVMISLDDKACAMVLFPDRKKVSLRSVCRDLGFIAMVTGFGNVGKVLKREQLINTQHADANSYYIWFIGVDPEHKGQGKGTLLLQELLKDAGRKGRPVYLETSVDMNVPWYQRAGLSVYHILDLGYRLFFLRTVP
jgi:ribosomal protein S18 acetylase RimI-like enzyme